MSPAAGLGLALRLARRELRSGLTGFTVFLACLALGVGSIAAVGHLAESVDRGLAREAKAILGGDLEVSRTHLGLTPEQADLLAGLGAVSHTVRARAMALSLAGGHALVELKAVDGAWPLYGRPTLAPALPLTEALAKQDGVFGVLAEQNLLDRLDLKVGDALKLGEAAYQVRAVLVREPDRVGGGFSLGPRLLMSLDGLAASGLDRPGALLRHSWGLRLPAGADAKATAKGLEASLGPEGFRVREYDADSTRVGRFAGNLAMYLTLAGLATLLVGGIGVAGAVRTFLAGKSQAIAAMKSLGASRRQVFAVCLLQVGALALAGSLLGLAGGLAASLGLGPLLGSRLDLPLEPGLHLLPLLTALGFGLLTALAFALPPLSAAAGVSPARLFRGYAEATPPRPTRRARLATGLLYLALAGLIVATARSRSVALGFVGGTAACALAFHFLARLVRALAARCPRLHDPRLRQAVAGLHRPGASTGSVLPALGLGLTVLAAVGLTDGNIQDQVRRRTPEVAPSYFFLDVPRQDMDRFREVVLGVPGVSRLEAQPSLRGRIMELNGKLARAENVAERSRWALRSDRAMTFAREKPADVDLVAGEWWPPDYAGPPLVCFDVELADGFGLKVGDSLTVSILGRPVTARIACLRRIDWLTLALNQTLIFAPGVLEDTPYSYLATAYAAPQAEKAVFAAVSRAFPGVAIVFLREVLAEITAYIGRIGLAFRSVAGVALTAGLLVLAEALRANLEARRREAVVFKVLGATRRDILAALALEFALQGGIAALAAAGLGAAASWAFIHYAVEAAFVFLPLPLLTVLGLGLAATLALGLLGVRSALSRSAWGVLRNE
jgi:putative ABC transport system permease protein